MQKNKARSRFIVACVAPATILAFIFLVVPTFNVFRMSLFKWGGYSPNQTFVGLDNFVTLFKDENFYRACRNSVLLIVVVTAITIVFALLFASILTREKLKGQNIFRVIFYVPNILSVVVISAIFSAIYDVNRGLLNNILSIFGIGTDSPMAWLGDQKIIVYSLAGAMVWQAIGYYMVMYMASMSAIPESLYESANLEGASRTTQFFSITLPLIWTNIRTTLTFFIISNINMSFLFVKAMTGGGPDGASEVFLSYMYKQAYTNSTYGYGMAVGVVVFSFSFALAAVVNRVTKREPLEF
ncbi:MAG TPA: sugar ABC transporter permease [Candidatus Ruthenibacterium merdavium]|uniref:Sugar ABC transporter permease n=1 Tax=Candidatus Ruthenibacterium merdavium TaxID=2838752 RepID=A0A9D2TKZ2_9FIRM|nr:sugar ABC transporter permease [Candidatus Ruthenibacterium merdavium]